MPSFEYSALDANGQDLSGAIESPGRAQAIASLAEQKLYVTQIESRGKKEAASASLAGIKRSRRVPLRLKVGMLRQLATALQAGLPLLSALQVVHSQAQNQSLRSLMGDLAERVQSGEALSQAMSEHSRNFSPLETSMVRVGETAGVLDQVMGYLSEFAEHDLDIREKIRSAATYPIFVLSLAVISVIVIVTTILPRVIASVTESVGEAVQPLPTQILMGVSDFLRSFGWLVLIGLGLGVWAFRAWLAKPEGRLAFDTFKLRIPVLGTAIRRIAVGRFARTLGTLSKSGIPILDALRVLRDTLGNEALAQKIDQAADGITQGQSVAEPLAQTGEFPPLLIQVIAMGEQTGKLDELLLQTADAYEKETSAAINRVMTILPAVFIVLLALLVGFILVAVLLPIVNMQTSVSGM